MKFDFQVDMGVASSFPVSNFYPVAAIFYSKWPPKPKNAPILMKFGFQVNISVASSFTVSKMLSRGGHILFKMAAET